MPSEQLDIKKHDKNFVIHGIYITNETLSNVILGLGELKEWLSNRTANHVRSVLPSILSEDKPDLTSNEPVYLRLKAKV